MTEHNLATEIRRLRRSRDLTQPQFGELVGISSSMIAQVETGGRSLSVENVEKIARALGMTEQEELELRKLRDKHSASKKRETTPPPVSRITEFFAAEAQFFANPTEESLRQCHAALKRMHETHPNVPWGRAYNAMMLALDSGIKWDYPEPTERPSDTWMRYAFIAKKIGPMTSALVLNDALARTGPDADKMALIDDAHSVSHDEVNEHGWDPTDGFIKVPDEDAAAIQATRNMQAIAKLTERIDDLEAQLAALIPDTVANVDPDDLSAPKSPPIRSRNDAER